MATNAGRVAANEIGRKTEHRDRLVRSRYTVTDESAPKISIADRDVKHERNEYEIESNRPYL